MIAAALVLLIWPSRELRSDNFVFYLPGNHQVMPVEKVGGSAYLPLLKVLNLVGTVGAMQEKKNTLKVWLGSTQLELRQDDKKVRLGKTTLSLANPVEIANGEWMVPLDFLYSALPRLTREPLEYRVGDRRMFIGDVRPATFSLRLDAIPGGARLDVEFSGKVTAQSASTNGKWVLLLGDTPVQPLEPTVRFQNHYLSEVQFDDQDGVPKLILTPGSPGLNFYPSSRNQGRELQVEVVQPGTVVAQQAQPQPPGKPAAGGPAQPPAATTPPATALVAPPAPPLPVVVLDAGHGGSDSGSHSRDGLLEKNLTAQLAARVAVVLSAGKKVRVVATRSGDADPSFDDRDAIANAERPTAFVTFHAGDLGTPSPRVIVYTYGPPAPPPPSLNLAALFVPWTWAQIAHLDRSRQLAAALAQQLGQVQGLTVAGPQAAPVRQLRSVNAAAVAVEVGSLASNADAGPLAAPPFQQQIADAIVRALTAWAGGPS